MSLNYCSLAYEDAMEERFYVNHLTELHKSSFIEHNKIEKNLSAVETLEAKNTQFFIRGQITVSF